MNSIDKSLVWLPQEIKSPPFSKEARLEAGFLLRKLQKGENLSLPHSRAMPTIGKRCHELRINDEQGTWRIIYRTDSDAIVLLEIFNKKTQQTPRKVIEVCKTRIKNFERLD